MPLVDNGVYVDGCRVTSPESLTSTFEAIRSHDGMAWIGLYRGTLGEVTAVSTEFDLHPLAVEDALTGHQRSKLERYGATRFIVLRPARYLDAEEEVEFGELHIFVGPDFVVTNRLAESPDLTVVRHRLEAEPELLALGPSAVVYAILDQVVDEYAPVIAGLENDIDEIEDQLFDDDASVSKRIYLLGREVLDFQRATEPIVPMLETLLREAQQKGLDVELQRNLRDVLDHALRVVERASAFRAILDNALVVESTIVARRQNEEMQRMSELGLAQSEEVKKISSWAAILFAPTLVGTVYGMNFTHMPELNWVLGYPMAIGLMLLMGWILYAVFRKKGWL